MPDPQRFCTFFLQHEFFGVAVEQVQEVIRYQPMTRVPLVPSVIRGLLNLRGQIVMAIDLRRRFGLRERPASEPPTNVIVRTGDGVVSFLVDEIGDVLELAEDSFEPLPASVGTQSHDLPHGLLRGVYKLDNLLMHVLDVEKTCDLTALPVDSP